MGPMAIPPHIVEARCSKGFYIVGSLIMHSTMLFWETIHQMFPDMLETSIREYDTFFILV